MFYCESLIGYYLVCDWRAGIKLKKCAWMRLVFPSPLWSDLKCLDQEFFEVILTGSACFVFLELVYCYCGSLVL